MAFAIFPFARMAYLCFQQLIANGTLAAGSGISGLLLAEKLGSSRTPIREAKNQLAAEGLLDQGPPEAWSSLA